MSQKLTILPTVPCIMHLCFYEIIILTQCMLLLSSFPSLFSCCSSRPENKVRSTQIKSGTYPRKRRDGNALRYSQQRYVSRLSKVIQILYYSYLAAVQRVKAALAKKKTAVHQRLFRFPGTGTDPVPEPKKIKEVLGRPKVNRRPEQEDRIKC